MKNIHLSYNKQSKKLFSVVSILLLLFLCGSFIACENFMQGSSLLDQLDTEINYSNSSFLNFRISASSDIGTTVPVATVYKDKYKTTDTENLIFTPRPEYQFLYWQATPSQYIKIDNPKNPATQIQFLKDTNDDTEIIVTPICAERPYPVVEPNNTGGNKPKNTPVTISFDQVIQNSEEDLSKIDIQIAGESILNHFKKPKFINEKRTILFDADDDNLLDFTSGTRQVSVIIPDCLYYTMPDGTEVHMNSEVTSSFTIDYKTVDSAILSLEIEDAAAGRLNRTGNHTFYMGEEFTVIYTVNEGYQFGGWDVSLSEGVSGTLEFRNDKYYLDNVAILEIVPNSVDFDEDYYASINKYQKIFKVLAGFKDIKISPKYYKKPVIQSISPSNRETVEKNSPIVILFSKKMNISEDELKKISISMDGLDASEYFENPVIIDDPISSATQITFRSKKDNLIDVPIGTKNITVTIPKSFNYTENGQNITLSSDYIYTYAINNNTVDKIKLQFIWNGDECSLDAQSEKTLYLNNSYTVHCTPKTQYEITGWKIYELNKSDESDDSTAVPSSILQVSKTDDNSSILFTAADGISGTIIVKPILTKKKYVEIKVNSDYGTTIPAGKAGTFYYGDELSLSYREQADYQFVGWKINKIINKADNLPVDLDSLVKFQDTIDENGAVEKGKDKFDTILQINELTDNYVVEIKAECAIRPKIVSATPSYDISGVYRDRRIVVLFDYSMNESSIYWTAAELEALGHTAEDKYKAIKGTDENDNLIYYTDEEQNTYYYAYEDEKGKHYKNITITKLEDSSQNLLEYYGMPRFSDDNNRFLEIEVEKNNPPPSSYNIVVTISGTVCTYNANYNTDLKLGANYSFSYKTSGSVDNAVPRFLKEQDQDDIFIKWGNKSATAKDNFNGSILNESSKNTLEVSSNLKANNFVGRNLWIKGQIEDNESGPKSLQWEVKKIDNKYYPAQKTGSFTATGQINKFDISGNVASFNEMIDFSNIKFIEGVYEFTLMAFDNNENVAKQNYYFVYDETPPANASSVSNSRTSAEKETINWTNPASADFDYLVIEQYDGEILNNTFIQESASVKTADFAGLINQHKYRYKIKAVDYCGNESTIKTYQDDTPPSKFKIRYSEGRNGRVNVFFTTPNDEDYCKTTVSWTKDSTQYDVSSASGRNKSSFKTFYDGTNWTLYNYYFRTYDYSGNCSDYVYLQEMAGAEPGMICYAPGNSPDNIFCSKNYWPGMNPIGIVADGSDQSKVKILASDESQSYTYGLGHSNFCADNAWQQYRWDIYVANGAIAYYNCQDGLKWYETVRDMPNYMDNAIGTNDQYGTYHDSIWTYAKNKNKNSAVTWWIPARHEWQCVAWNWKSMCSARDVLKNNNESFANMSNNTKYYVATPNYYTSSCNMVGINYTDNGNLNEYLANGEWMNMYTTSYKRDAYARSGYYGAYVRCMAFIDMN